MTPHPAAPLPRQPLLATLFVGLLYIAGNLSNGIYPVFVNAVLKGGYATTGNVGVLATAEFLPFGLSIMFAGRFLPERNLRLIAGMALIVHVLTSYATTKLSFAGLVPCRALFGAAGGVLVWISYAFIARAVHAGRLVAIYITALMVLGVGWSWLAPNVIVPLFGQAGVIILMVVPSLLAILFLPLGPSELAELPENIDDKGVPVKGWLPLPSLLILFSIGLWATFMTIFWVYADPIAARQTGSLVRHWLTLSLMAQIAGAALSAVLAERLPYKLVVTLGLVVSIAQISSIMMGVSGLAFVVWTTIYGFIGYFLVPFFISGLLATDPSRRSVVYFPAAQNLAGSIGPLLVAEFVSDTDLSVGLRIDLGAIVLAPIVFWIAILVHRRIHRSVLPG